MEQHIERLDMDCKTTWETLKRQWDDVMVVWIDPSANAVEARSVNPLFKLLNDGQRLSEEAMAKADSLKSEAQDL